jgi:retron-type reverse transcriptase
MPDKTKSRSMSFEGGLKRILKLSKEKGQCVNKVMHILWDPEYLLVCYWNIRSRPGNMTRGVDLKTLDGTDRRLIMGISEELKAETFKFKPSRNVIIPKPNGGERPLMVPSPRDKIVQEGMRIILETVFEHTFSVHSHGFRPEKGCHTALNHIRMKFGGVKWFLEGDIKSCFPSVDQRILIEFIRSGISDSKFIDLVNKSMKAGYVDFEGTFYRSRIGTPQGSIISPILSNI